MQKKNRKSPRYLLSGAFPVFLTCRADLSVSIRAALHFFRSTGQLLALSSLMPCTGQKLSVFMLSHFFSSFFNDAAQSITSHLYFFEPERTGAYDYSLNKFKLLLIITGIKIYFISV